MKKNLLNVLLLIIGFNYLNAQVTPVTTSVNGNYTLYKSNKYDQHKDIIAQQSYELKQKISNSSIKAVYQLNSFESTFLEQSINTSNYLTLKDNKERLKILYNVDQDGNTYSCAFVIRTSSINNLGLEEVETILKNAMQHKFNLSNIPDGITTFFYAFSVMYVIQ